MLVDRTLVTPAAELPGRRRKTAKKVNEMFVSATGLPSTVDPVAEPMPQPHTAAPPAAPSAEASSTEVLISTQEVLFSTATAVGVRRESIGDRLAAIMRRMLATSTDEARPRPQHEPRRYGFLENALMAREMDRL
jgi:hypothetical protein